jgi:hypothetical protein
VVVVVVGDDDIDLNDRHDFVQSIGGGSDRDVTCSLDRGTWMAFSRMRCFHLP